MIAMLGSPIRASLVRMKYQRNFAAKNPTWQAYAILLTNTLVSQAVKTPIIHIWRQFNPFGIRFHKMTKPPSIPIPIGKIEIEVIDTALFQL